MPSRLPMRRLLKPEIRPFGAAFGGGDNETPQRRPFRLRRRLLCQERKSGDFRYVLGGRIAAVERLETKNGSLATSATSWAEPICIERDRSTEDDFKSYVRGLVGSELDGIRRRIGAPQVMCGAPPLGGSGPAQAGTPTDRVAPRHRVTQV